MGLFQKIFRGKKENALEEFEHLKPVDRRKELRNTSDGKVMFNEFRLYGKTYYFRYTNKAGDVSDRIIKLVTVTTYSDGRVKISGYDNKKNEMRRFNLDYAENFQDEDLQDIKEPKKFFLSLVSDMTPEKMGEIHKT